MPVCLKLNMSRSPTDLQSGMSVYGGSLIRHVGLQWVFDEACWSPMKLLEVSDQACRYLMKHFVVSDGSPIRHVGL